MRHFLQEQGISDIEIMSAGIAALEGTPAAPTAIEVSHKWGIDLVNHRAQPVSRDLLEQANLILAMAPEHIDFVLQVAPEVKDRLYLLKEYPAQSLTDRDSGVVDPIGKIADEYEKTFLDLEEQLRRIFSSLVQRAHQDS